MHVFYTLLVLPYYHYPRYCYCYNYHHYCLLGLAVRLNSLGTAYFLSIKNNGSAFCVLFRHGTVGGVLARNHLLLPNYYILQD